MLIISHARSSSSRRSCPEEYRELRRRSDDSSSASDDDQWREDLCDQAMAVRQHDPTKYQSALRAYCAHYDEALELTRENNDTLCEDKKRAIDMRRKRQQTKKKREDDSMDSDDDDDDDDDKRRALRKRELKKRVALRFIRKRMS